LTSGYAGPGTTNPGPAVTLAATRRGNVRSVDLEGADRRLREIVATIPAGDRAFMLEGPHVRRADLRRRDRQPARDRARSGHGRAPDRRRGEPGATGGAGRVAARVLTGGASHAHAPVAHPRCKALIARERDQLQPLDEDTSARGEGMFPPARKLRVTRERRYLRYGRCCACCSSQASADGRRSVRGRDYADRRRHRSSGVSPAYTPNRYPLGAPASARSVASPDHAGGPCDGVPHASSRAATNRWANRAAVATT
jgi:hypothetical protein